MTPQFRCSNYIKTVRCEHGADVKLIAEDSRPVPGGYCRECADRIVKEFAEKLGDIWTIETLETWKHRTITAPKKVRLTWGDFQGNPNRNRLEKF